MNFLDTIDNTDPRSWQNTMDNNNVHVSSRNSLPSFTTPSNIHEAEYQSKRGANAAVVPAASAAEPARRVASTMDILITIDQVMEDVLMAHVSFYRLKFITKVVRLIIVRTK